MELAQLILEFIKTLAWPVLVLFALIFFRIEVRTLLNSLQRLRLPGGTELDWQKKLESLSPEQQRTRLEEEIEATSVGGANAVPNAKSSMDASALKTNAILAEDLVMRQLEAELGVSIQRQVTYKQRPDLSFDGFAVVQDTPMLIEVKYIRSENTVPSVIQAMRGRLEKISAETPTLPPRGILILVANVAESDRARIEATARRLAPPDTPPLTRFSSRLEVRVYDFNELKSKFGIDKAG